MKIYDTFSKKKKKVMIDRNNIRIYLCGPTVYGDNHFGHFRYLLFFDLVSRLFNFKRITSTIVINITDIDPKIVSNAKEKNIEVKKYVEKNAEEFFKDCRRLELDDRIIFATVSDYVDESTKIIKKLISKNNAYQSFGNTYLYSYNLDLGILSKFTKQEITNMRFDLNPGKKDSNDILLWNSSEIFDNYFYDPDLGKGIPWWHIQDVSVIMSIFNGQYDIHGGATDLILPHHEHIRAIISKIDKKNKSPKFWMHVGLVYLNGIKMSKSTNNVLLIREMLKKYNTNTIRLYSYSEHYRDKLFFSRKKINLCKKLDYKIEQFLFSKQDKQEKNSSMKLLNKFVYYLENDFNTVEAINLLAKSLKESSSYKEIITMVKILGLTY